MPFSTPDRLRTEQQALEAEIREAFKGVTREGGVSWSEAEVLDGYGSDEACRKARAQDTDRSWTEFADNPTWDPGTGYGGWSFLDGIGFRYYLPAAMIRALQAGYEAFSGIYIDNILIVPAGHRLQPFLDDRQRRCIGRFVRFMIALEESLDHRHEAEHWRRLSETCWKDAGQT